ncbi:MAG: histidine phosphatase family protein [Anaerolineales bacterium]
MTASGQGFTHRITLLRHGESTGNAQGVYQGRAEYDLSAKGRDQVRALARYWRENGSSFSLIISSPQARAGQSAQIISEMMNVPVEFNDQWQEIDNGVLAGLHLGEDDAQYLLPEYLTPFDQIGETGESNWDIYRRAGKVVQDLINLPRGDYLVVSHGGFLNRVLYVVLGIVPQVNFSGARFHFENTAYAVLLYNPSRYIWRVEQFNSKEHLQGD